MAADRLFEVTLRISSRVLVNADMHLTSTAVVNPRNDEPDKQLIILGISGLE